MTCILPSLKINHVPLDEALDDETFTAISKSMKEEYMIVRLLRFEVEMNNSDTLEILRSIGLNAGDKFSLITDKNDFYLSCFIHATKIKVDENGTEGAAVSLGGMDEAVGPGMQTTIYAKLSLTASSYSTFRRTLRGQYSS